MSDFTSVSESYRQKAAAQHAASKRLFDLLGIGKTEDVLDLGCGPGHLTHEIRLLTDGQVSGVDPSPGMIVEARKNYPSGIDFSQGAAEALAASCRFDAIFCNSALQWFRDPDRAIANCAEALRPNGRMAVQAPATKEYCPKFVQAFGTLRDDPRTRDAFWHFREPWFFCESAEGYSRLFEKAGFSVLSSRIDEQTLRCGLDQAVAIFESGAALGYLNSEYYAVELPHGFMDVARELISRALESQVGPDGVIELKFFRLYLLVQKADAKQSQQRRMDPSAGGENHGKAS